MMRRWHVFLAAGLLISAGVGVLLTRATGSTLFREVGTKMGIVHQMEDIVVARVNGEAISLKEIETRKATMVMNRQLTGQSDQVTRKEALQALLRLKVQMAEARSRGLIPSDAEIKQQVTANEAQWANAPLAERQRRDTIISEYIQGAGITRAEYDRNEFTATRIELAVTRLRSDFKAKLTDLDAAKKEQLYISYVDELVKNARVEILREDQLAN